MLLGLSMLLWVVAVAVAMGCLHNMSHMSNFYHLPLNQNAHIRKRMFGLNFSIYFELVF